MAIGTTIDDLNTVTSLTAQDKVPVWDAEASNEPTKKITAQNMANSMKSLANLPNTTEMNAAIEQSTATGGSNYFQSPDGTLIQWGRINSGALTSDSVTAVPISLSQSFINDTYSINAMINSAAPQQFSVSYSNVAVNGFRINVYSSGNFTNGAYLLWIAVGRWKA